MIQIYGRAANRFARQQTHWVTMEAVLCLCGDEYVPNLNWDDGTVNIYPIQYYTIRNKTISGDGWCSAEQVRFPEFVLDRPCSQAVIFQPLAAPANYQQFFYLSFPVVLPSLEPRPLSLLFGVNRPGWFRL